MTRSKGKRLTLTAGAVAFTVIAGCETSRVDQENSDPPSSADTTTTSQENHPEQNDELERADLLAESRALEVAKSLVIAREGWSDARCISTRKQDGWSVLVSRNPRERFADELIVEVSREGEVTGYRYAR